MTVECTVDEILDATRRAVAGNPQCADWSWTKERHDIERMCFDFISGKHPELIELLPDKLLASWRQRRDAGDEHVKVMWSGYANQWCVTSRKKRDGGGTAGGETAATEAPKKGAAPRFVLRPFALFDPAKLQPRQWLYGRHYQRGTVSGTIAPGGFGKTTLVMVEAIAMATCRTLLGEQPEQRLRLVP